MTCFIEQCFRKRILQHPGGKDILNKWESDKKAYRDRTALTAFDFQHFSMHDESHSVKILNYVELLLGKNRIANDLSVGDLWLLLECAYFHDIGMTLTKDQRTNLWLNDKKFREYITDRLKDNSIGPHRDIFEAAQYYKHVDDLLNGKYSSEVLDEDITHTPDWPETLNDKIRLLMTDYIRQHHADYCRNALDEIVIKDSEFFDGVIEKRLYELVSIISAQHTKEFHNIFLDLQYQEIAFGNIYIHPQFIAALLRIGDVLDIDNNRFNVRVLDHIGTLPPSSALHLEKHKSLTNYNVSSYGITAVACSSDLDVCKITRDWFNWIESEVKEIKYHWNNIAPKRLNHCRLKFCDLRVFLNGNEFTSHNVNQFSFDSRKMQKLLIGDSIYSCKLDCIREYIQNSIDASKVKVWEILKHENAEYLFKNSNHSWPWSMTLPCDLKEDIFNQFPISIELSLRKATKLGEIDQIIFSIHDYGIGMDSACVKDITTIGKGWRNRLEYQDVFCSAPKWLRPTGGFGIGIQSAFMLTDQVIYLTRSENEPYGHVIRLDSPSKGGNVSDEIRKGVLRGTKVEFAIDAFLFLDPSLLGLSNTVQEYVRKKMNATVAAMFSDQYLLELAGTVCRGYIEEQLPNSLFPIRFSFRGQKSILLPSPSYYEYDIIGNEIVGKYPLRMHSFKDMNTTDVFEDSSKDSYVYHILPNEQIPTYDGRDKKIILWSRTHMDCVDFIFSDAPLNHSIGKSATITFKDILVPDHGKELEIPNVIYRYNLLGQTAGNALLVSRAKLNRDFESIFLERLYQYLYCALTILIPESIKENIVTANSYKRMLFALISQKAFQKGLSDTINTLQICDHADSTYLNTIYHIKPTNPDADDSLQYSIVREDAKNAISELLKILSKYHENPSQCFVLYTLSHIDNTNESIVPSAHSWISVFSIQQTEYYNSDELESENADNLDSEYDSLYCGFFEQDIASTKYSSKKEYDSLLQNICIFSEDWEYCFANLLIDKNTVLIKKISPFVLSVESDAPTLNRYYKITKFHFKNVDSSDIDHEIYHTHPLFDDLACQAKYPQLRVKAVPFPKSGKSSNFKFAHLIPGKEILGSLTEVGLNHREITTEAIRQALITDAGLLTDFKRLVRWTYIHQYKNSNDNSYSYQEIEQAYLTMLLDIIKSLNFSK